MSRFADAYPFPTFASPLRFAIAMAAVSVVFVTDVVAVAALDDVGRFLLLGTAVLASAWFAGTGPALAATILGAALGWVSVGPAANHGDGGRNTSCAVHRAGVALDRCRLRAEGGATIR
jgi:hypothetical protein